MKKFIKVANFIMNILLGIYELFMMVGMAVVNYSSDREAIAVCAAVIAVAIFVMNYSAKVLVKIWDKVEKKK